MRAELQTALDTHFPARELVLQGYKQTIREVGQGPVVILLHGISSGAASWLMVANHLQAKAKVIAWDAPGYVASAALQETKPKASDYATRLMEIIAKLAIQKCVLVGHSLGALMAMATASALKNVIAKVVLISPARGYGDSSKLHLAQQIRTKRLDTLAKLGIEGLAETRASHLLSNNANSQQLAWVKWNMLRLNPQGYSQAVELLCGDELFNYLVTCPIEVYCGDQDEITTPTNCKQLAELLAAPYTEIAQAGHISPIEQPKVVAEFIYQAIPEILKGSMV